MFECVSKDLCYNIVQKQHAVHSEMDIRVANYTDCNLIELKLMISDSEGEMAKKLPLPPLSIFFSAQFIHFLLFFWTPLNRIGQKSDSENFVFSWDKTIQ